MRPTDRVSNGNGVNNSASVLDINTRREHLVCRQKIGIFGNEIGAGGEIDRILEVSAPSVQHKRHDDKRARAR